MSENSKIEWTDHTFNPFIGCTKVSPGCDHCYAEQLMDKRMHKVAWGPHGERVRTSEANWREPIRWNARHEQFFAKHGRRQRVFCASLADVFDNAVSVQWRYDLLRLIMDTPNLDWLLLTKRIGNAEAMLEQAMRARTVGREGWRDNGGLSNVWIGATIVNQEEADRDIPKLLATPARVRFLSMEPLLGPVTLRNLPIGNRRAQLGFPAEHDRFDVLMGSNKIDWVIVGGESGPGARPMHPDWVRSLRDQCAAAGVPFLFKQWGEWAPPAKLDDLRSLGDMMRAGKAIHVYGPGRGHDGHFRKGDDHMLHIGKKAAGRLLDGVQHDGLPVHHERPLVLPG